MAIKPYHDDLLEVFGRPHHGGVNKIKFQEKKELLQMSRGYFSPNSCFDQIFCDVLMLRAMCLFNPSDSLKCKFYIWSKKQNKFDAPIYLFWMQA